MVFDADSRANGLSQLTQSSLKVSAAPADDVHCLLGLRQNPGAVAIRFQVVDSCRQRPGTFGIHVLTAQMSRLYVLSLRKMFQVRLVMMLHISQSRRAPE